MPSAQGARHAGCMADLIGAPESVEEQNRQYAALLKSVNGEGERPFQLVTANALWGQQGYHFKPDFKKAVADFYDGAFHEVNFRAQPDEAGHGRRSSEQAARRDAKRPLAARALLRRQDGHALHSRAEVLLDGRILRPIGGLIDRLEQSMASSCRCGPVPLGHAGGAARQDRVGDECRAGFRRRRSLRPLRLAPGQYRLADLDHAGGKPLPRKLVITNRGDEARPQSVRLIDWNLKPDFKDSVFKFTPPKGATKIEIVPRKAK